MRRLIFLCGEATPFAASGGLGDVMGALPRSLAHLLGKRVEVGVILPFYGSIEDGYRREMQEVYRGEFFLAWRRVPFTVHSLFRDGVAYFFVSNSRYFDRPELYGEFDDGERFAFFCRAALEFLLGSDRIPDVLHANDWQAALGIVYLRTLYAADPRTAGIRTVLTVHNIAYQGRYDPAILSDVLDLHPSHGEILEYDGCLNLLKGGMVLADRVTTVSPRYAEELMDPCYGAGLSGFLASLSPRITGILNGLDTTFFDPEDATVLAAPYTAKTLVEGKRKNKAAIRRFLGLGGGKAPLLLMVTRLTESKGIDLLLAILPRLLAEGVQLVILGTGEEHYHERLASVAAQYPEAIRVLLRFDRDLSKQLYAGADLFLMPSKSEPCGLAQMTACRYGTVPIVRATGGLADSILPFGRPGGCGFLFSDYSPDAFLETILDAVALYRAEDGRFTALCRTAMKTDFSWRRAAAHYRSLYKELWEEE